MPPTTTTTHLSLSPARATDTRSQRQTYTTRRHSPLRVPPSPGRAAHSARAAGGALARLRGPEAGAKPEKFFVLLGGGCFRMGVGVGLKWGRRHFLFILIEITLGSQ